MSWQIAGHGKNGCVGCRWYIIGYESFLASIINKVVRQFYNIVYFMHFHRDGFVLDSLYHAGALLFVLLHSFIGV